MTKLPDSITSLHRWPQLLASIVGLHCWPPLLASVAGLHRRPPAPASSVGLHLRPPPQASIGGLHQQEALPSHWWSAARQGPTPQSTLHQVEIYTFCIYLSLYAQNKAHLFKNQIEHSNVQQLTLRGQFCT